MASAAYWRCPICLRRVPDKVVECHCGRKRQPGDGPDEGPAKGGGGGALGLALGVVAIAGLAVLTLRRPAPPAAPPANPVPAVAPEAAGASPESLPVTPVRARDLPAFTGSSPDPGAKGAAAAPPAPFEPRPTPTAAPEDSVDARREQGRLAFELAMRNLQGKVDVLGRRLENLARTCPPEATRVIGCDGLRQEIARDAEEIRTTAAQAEEKARLGWVDPGAIRDARERYGMREGDVLELLARANEALKR